MAASAATSRAGPLSSVSTSRGTRCRPFLQVCHAGRHNKRSQLIRLDDLADPQLFPAGSAPPADGPVLLPQAAPQPRRSYSGAPMQRGGYNSRDPFYPPNGGGGYSNNYSRGGRNQYYDGRNSNRQYSDIGTMDVDDDGYYTVDPDGGNEPEPEPLYVGGKRLFVNQEISAREVRLQTETGESMGIVSLSKALEMAAEEEVDVVCLNDELSPPLCRLVAASKYKFEWERAQKASKKKQRETQVEVKEVRLRPITDVADLETKARNAQKFLSKGAKVKITMSFTGREQRFKEQGRELLLKLIEQLSELATLEGPVSVRGSTFSAMLAPHKKAA